MSKIFETIRRLEQNPDGVAVDRPLETTTTFPVLPPPLPAPRDRSAPIEKRTSLSIHWHADTPVEDAPMEATGSRIMAIGIDAGIVLVALVLFVGVFFLSGGVLTFARDIPLLGSVLAILALFYWFLCLLANHGSPGMHFAGVREFEAEEGPAHHGQLGLHELPAAAPPPPLARPKAPLAITAPVRPTVEDLLVANKILANEKVLDAYGNVSVRDDRNSGHFFLARQVGGSLLTPADVIEYDLDGNPVSGDPFAGHSERFIHSEIYKARPEVMAIVHWRAAEIIPFTASSVRLRPVSETAAFLGEGVPVIEVNKIDGGVDFAIRTRASAQSLAESLGDKPVALLRGHGALVVASSLHAAVAKAYYMNMNARLQVQAIQLGGEVNYVPAAESRTAVPLDEFEPAWEFFKQRLPVNGTHR